MSIAEVAKIAGVSAATVSNIINNKRKASDETVRRVLSAMEEIRYVPRPVAQRPGRKTAGVGKSGGLKKIALIVPNCGLAQFQNPIYSFLADAISQAAYERGASMMLCRIPSQGQMPENIYQGEMDGLVFVLKAGADPYVDALSNFPKVGILGHTDSRMDAVTVNNSAVGRMAADYLRSLNLASYACLYDRVHPAQVTRARAFQDTCEAHGVPAITECGDELLIINDRLHEPDPVKIDHLLERILQKVNKPFGLFSPTDLTTTAVYPALYRRGLQPEKDVWVISCDNEIPYLIGLSPKPAEIDLNLAAMARRTLDQLLWRIQNPSAPVNTVLISPALIPPESNTLSSTGS